LVQSSRHHYLTLTAIILWKANLISTFVQIVSLREATLGLSIGSLMLCMPENRRLLRLILVCHILRNWCSHPQNTTYSLLSTAFTQIIGISMVINSFKFVGHFLNCITLYFHIIFKRRLAFDHIKSRIFRGCIPAFWVSLRELNLLIITLVLISNLSLSTLKTGSRCFATTSEWLLLSYTSSFFWRLLRYKVTVNWTGFHASVH
jgi:hypothetical protein